MQVISYLEEEFDEQTGVRIQLPEHFRSDTLLFDENSQLIRPMPAFKSKLQLVKHSESFTYICCLICVQMIFTFYFAVQSQSSQLPPFARSQQERI